MNRKQKALIALLALLACSTLAGEKTASETAFKQYCESNTWYFSKIIALPSTLPGFERNELSNKMQAFFKTPARSDVIYSKYELIKVKAIEIKGEFTKLEGTNDLYRLENDYTRRSTNDVLIMGAFDHHLFEVDSRNFERGKTQALLDALKLAGLVLESWGKKQNIEPAH